MLELTSGKQTISGQLLRVYNQSSSSAARMSGRKCPRAVTTDETPFTYVPPAKRGVNKRTADKWLAEYDKELNKSVWLRYELADRHHVVALKCEVCVQFRTRLESMRNYHSAFIDGTTNVRTSTFKEHARTDMHTRAMSLFKKQQSSTVLEYAPIARALTNLPMDERSKQVQKASSRFHT